MDITLDSQLLATLESDPGTPGGTIWRDSHVQRQLLAAHLDESTTAATRAPEAVRRTIDLVTEGLAAGAAVLDLGCGPGLYSQPLAERGFQVTGVDLNAASLDYARRRDGTAVTYIESDYTRALPTGPFDLVILIYLDFGTHHPAVQRTLLRQIRTRLRPGGRLVLDYLDAAAATRHTPGRDWHASATGGFWSPDPHLLLTETTIGPDACAQRTRYTLLTGAGPRRFDVWEHCFDEGRMRALAAEAGFAQVQLHRQVLDRLDPQADDVVFAVATA